MQRKNWKFNPSTFKYLILVGLLFIISIDFLSLKVNTNFKAVPLKIGNTTVFVNLYHKWNSDIIYFNMHDNENTAVEAAKYIVNKYGGYLVELHAQEKRTITFILDGEQFTFDPNRIFTNVGIKKTLKKYGKYSTKAHSEINRFVHDLLHYLLGNNIKLIVAVHNNTNNNYSVRSYSIGGLYEKDAQDVYFNPHKDIDDFFYIIEEKYFCIFKDKGFNVVLQNNKNVTDDGSLSVYCRDKNIQYINVEAEHGHLHEQIEMLEEIQNIN